MSRRKRKTIKLKGGSGAKAGTKSNTRLSSLIKTGTTRIFGRPPTETEIAIKKEARLAKEAAEEKLAEKKRKLANNNDSKFWESKNRNELAQKEEARKREDQEYKEAREVSSKRPLSGN